MGPSCQLGIARFVPANKRLLGAGLRSSLTLQNETVYKTLIITMFVKVKCTKIRLLRLILKITSEHIHRRVEGDTSVAFGHIINPLLTKLVRLRWLDIGLVLFLRFTWPISSHLDLTLVQIATHLHWHNSRSSPECD